MDLVYQELRTLASSYLRRERPGQTLQTSALVNEAYLRLANSRSLQYEDRRHYLVIAARAMRRVLVDAARRRHAYKREAGERVDLDNASAVHIDKLEEYVTVDAALEKLAGIDPRQAQIVELRFFGGLSVTETADALNVSDKTVKRDWAVARAWLHGELGGASQP